MFTICFAGHRSLLDEKNVQHQIEETLDFLIKKYVTIQCKTSLAAGADILFAKAVLDRNIPLEVFLPFDIEDFVSDFPADALKNFYLLLPSVNYTVEKKLVTQSPDERSQAFFDLGNKLIASSDALIAVWDGQDSAGIGGTKDQIDLALAKNKEVHWIKALKKHREYPKINEPVEKLKASFTEHDQLAIQYKKQYERSWFLGLLLGMLAVCCFAYNFTFIPKGGALLKFFLSVSEIAFLLSSFYFLSNTSNNAKYKFVTCRRDAEKLRGEIWLNEVNQIKSVFLAFHQLPGTTKSIWLNTQRIIHTYALEQLHYQKERRINRFKSNLALTNRALGFLKYLFLAIVVFIAIIEGFHAFHIHMSDGFERVMNFLCFLWILIPPAFATTEGVIYFNEWKKQIITSTDLAEQFEQISLDALQTEEEAALLLLEDKLLKTFTFEYTNWANVQNQKQIHSKI